MVAETFDHTLRAFCQRAPFRSFVVELVSGSRIVVEHPEALVYRAGVAVYISRPGALSIFDHEGVSRITELTESGSAQAA
ncbi:MAG: hypothetical protein QOE70_771 [Chthoniobacter sp.]|jgi:hypothetical protein|nr:hypothetical protein [Chthoniobacter sp.]